MITDVTSQTGIRFINPTVLVDHIRIIEDRLPGWWWSISQCLENLTFSAGPGRNCPNRNDILFSVTEKGDKGFINKFRYIRVENDFVDSMFNDLILNSVTGINNERVVFANSVTNEDLPDIPSTYRKQTEENLKALEDRYSRLLEEISLIEGHGHVFKEIYIGSWDWSADCSLRGHRSDKSEFDISVDLTGVSSIAEALSTAHQELNSDILTPGSFDDLPDDSRRVTWTKST